MRVSCAEDKTVTIYFDICINVIIHWYGNPHLRRRIYREERDKGKLTGDMTTSEAYDAEALFPSVPITECIDLIKQT